MKILSKPMHKKTLLKILSLLTLLSLSAFPSHASSFVGYDSEETLRYLAERDSAYEELSGAPAVVLNTDEDTVTRISTGNKAEGTKDTPLFVSASVSVSGGISHLEIPKSVVGILSERGNFLDTKGAFYENKSLKRVISPRGLEYIGDKAFYGSAVEYVFFPYLLRHIGSYSFAYCRSLGSVSIHGNTAVGDGAFAGCENLSEVYLSSRVRRIGLGAFEHTPFYDRLTDELCIVNGILIKYNGSGGDVVIPDGVRVIADGCFAGRASIRSVTLPYSLEYIGNSAFRSCARLESVIFPTYSENDDGVQNLTLGENSFDGCFALSGEVLELLASFPVDSRDMRVYADNRHILTASPISFLELIERTSALEDALCNSEQEPESSEAAESGSELCESEVVFPTLPKHPSELYPHLTTQNTK